MTSINANKKNNAGFLDFKELALALMACWPWILISVILALLLAFFYVYKKPNVYLRELTFIANNMTTDKSRVSVASGYIEDMLPSNDINYNDMALELKSAKVMKEVVHGLGLEFSYQCDEKPLYGYQLPVVLYSLENKTSTNGFFSLKVDKSGAILLHDLNVNGKEVSNTYLTVPGDTLATPYGHIVLSAPQMIEYWKKSDMEVTVKVLPTENVALSLAGKLVVSRVSEKTSAISCRMTDQLPQRAEDVLNAIIPVYCEQLRENQTNALKNAGFWLQNRVNVIERELSEIDGRKNDINQRYAVPNVSSAAGSYFAESHSASAQKNELSTKLSMIHYLRSLLSENMKKSEFLPLVSGVNDVSLISQINEYNTLVRRRNSLVISGGELHPQVVEVDKAIAESRSILISTLDNLNDITLTQIEELRRVTNNANRKVVDMVDSETSQLSIERQQKVKESMYMFLLQKLEENYVNQTAINPTVKVLSAASGSSKPIAPKRVQIFILALAIGFMIPVVIVFLLETSDTRIHSKRDLSLLQCAYVGELPEMEREKKCSNRKKRGDKSQDWVVKEDGNDFVNEAFRMVRTNLNFMLSGGGDSKKVLMSTSFLPGVGKTFVLMNLGTAFALQGKRVLLIDLDMRKSSLSRQVHKPLRGISEYLNGSELNLDAIKIKNVSCEGLELIPVGVEPPNPTELLSNSTRLSELFDTVRSEYDYILVDCPPFNMVADSMLVNSYVDITMFVLRAEISDRSQVDELNRVQAEGPLRHLAVLLNGVKPKKLYYYRKKYKYGYGYGYVKK